MPRSQKTLVSNELIPNNRCKHFSGNVRCCDADGHNGPHLYKCAGNNCPGLSWKASDLPHPVSCI